MDRIFHSPLSMAGAHSTFISTTRRSSQAHKQTNGEQIKLLLPLSFYKKLAWSSLSLSFGFLFGIWVWSGFRERWIEIGGSHCEVVVHLVVGGAGSLDEFVVGVGCSGLMDWSMAAVVIGGLICSCGFRIAGSTAWCGLIGGFLICSLVAVFILNFWVCLFSCGFDDFTGFMGLICWRFRWRIGILYVF